MIERWYRFPRFLGKFTHFGEIKADDATYVQCMATMRDIPRKKKMCIAWVGNSLTRVYRVEGPLASNSHNQDFDANKVGDLGLQTYIWNYGTIPGKGNNPIFYSYILQTVHDGYCSFLFIYIYILGVLAQHGPRVPFSLASLLSYARCELSAYYRGSLSLAVWIWQLRNRGGTGISGVFVRRQGWSCVREFGKAGRVRRYNRHLSLCNITTVLGRQKRIYRRCLKGLPTFRPHRCGHADFVR